MARAGSDRGGDGQAVLRRVTDDPPSPAERVSRAILDWGRSPHNRVIQRKLYSVGDFELTAVQVHILETVVARPGQRMNELAQTLGVDASTVSRTIRPLLDLALIERRAGESDRREACLMPTDAGNRQAAAIATARRDMAQAVQGHLAPERLALFADLFEEYLEAIAIEGRRVLEDERGSA